MAIIDGVEIPEIDIGTKDVFPVAVTALGFSDALVITVALSKYGVQPADDAYITVTWHDDTEQAIDVPLGWDLSLEDLGPGIFYFRFLFTDGANVVPVSSEQPIIITQLGAWSI